MSPTQDLILKGKNTINEPLKNEEWDNKINIYAITPELIKNIKEPEPRPRINEKLLNETNKYSYHIGKGDILSITVWEHPELTSPAGQYRSASETGTWVDDKGEIFFPYIGRLKVEGDTVNNVREKITQALKSILETPQLDVKVASFNSQKVYISGKVKKPGNISITNIPLTILDVIDKVEGFSDDADLDNVILTRGGENIKISLSNLINRGDLIENHLLTDKDVLYIPNNQNLKVFVMGEVHKQSTLTINSEGMSLAEAISNSNGINLELANASGIFVIRPISSHNTLANIYQLNAIDASVMVLATEFMLKPYDIVYVTSAPLTKWNRVINQLTPTISNIHSLVEITRQINKFNK